MQTPTIVRPSREQGLPTPPASLPEHRAKQVEAGLATFQSVIAERDTAERKLRDAVLKIEGMEVQLSSLQGVINMMESSYLSTKLDLEKRVHQCQHERDEAVSRTVMLETIIKSIQLVIENNLSAELPPHVG
jgi:hypothetical protein